MSDSLESSQDYLEKILMLHEKFEVVRAIDIAEFMNFSKPSVSIAMKKLKEKGLIEVNEKTGNITLTDEGNRIAASTYERHKTLTAIFEHLGVNPKTAEDDACKIEHDLSVETFSAIKDYVAKVKAGKIKEIA